MADVERITPSLPTLPPVGRGTGGRSRTPEPPRKPRNQSDPERRRNPDQPPEHIDEYV
jgi:hypothetical protein